VGAQASPPDAGTDSGLDSLASATLTRALEYLDVARPELGFDKLYAEDDTFRLSVVEDILNDPLSLPGWQQQVVSEFRAAADDPIVIANLLGALGDAPDDAAHGAWRWPATRFDADGYWETDRSTDRDSYVGDFIASVQSAEALLHDAFAELTPEETAHLVMAAPAFWGNWEDDADDITRKGRLQFEMGLAPDTTAELSEDPILDMAAKMDRSALTGAARMFLAALSELANGAVDLPQSRALQHAEGVDGSVVLTADSPWGLIVVGGPRDNTYSAEALSEIAVVIDLGGDDIYRGRAASAIGTLTRSFSAVVDLGGDDLYDASDLPFALGGALLGVAVLIDTGGDDIYRGDDGSAGAGFFGAGFLYDRAGTDFYSGRNLCQGAGAFGIGALVSDGAGPPPPGPELTDDRAFDAGLKKVPGTGAVPIRHNDNDTYLCARFSQGFASTFGVGILYDRFGSDTYRSGGRYVHAPLRPDDFQSLSQGYSIGFRPRAGGGVGLLLDEEGNDFYNGEIYAQGVGYWYSIGLLFDGAGNDSYHASQYAQGAGVHLAVGTLWDRGGEDQYVSKFGVTQGTGHDYSAAFFLDEEGNDYYVVDNGQGVSLTNSTAIFIDAHGNDFYATYGGGQGWVRWARGSCGPGIFLDLEGKDTYSRWSPGADGSVWTHNTYGLGIDLDRDLELPGEKVPEVVLTAEDSLRAVDELFETASIWEVGSAREKVRRARKALIAKGTDAVDYVLREKLATRKSLEYRTIEELAKAHPDSFTARAIFYLESDDETTRRNMIRVMGELKRPEAREPLERMLGKNAYRDDWYRMLYALGRIGDLEASRTLRSFLAHDSERIRINAVRALAALKDSAAAGLLSDRLSDSILTVRAAASDGLQRLGTASITPLCESLDAGATQRAIRIRTLGKLAFALRDSSDAASLVARSRARRVLMAALDASSEAEPPAARAAAVEALMKLGEEETIAFVTLRMLDEHDPLVRRMYELAMKAVE